MQGEAPLERALSLQGQFKGRICSASRDRACAKSDLKGEYTILYPIDKEDVAIACELAEVTGKQILVRSGSRKTRNSVIDASQQLVVNMKRFDGITFQDSSVQVQAAVKVSDLAEALTQKKCFLPLDELADRSVVAAALSTSPGFLSNTVGRLRDFIKSIEYVEHQPGTTNVVQISDWGNEEERKAWTSYVMNKQKNGIILSITFDLSTAKVPDQLWLSRLQMIYNTKVFDTFVTSFKDGDFPKNCDVAISVIPEAYSMDMVCVTVAGIGKRDDYLLKRFIKAAGVPEQTYAKDDFDNPVDVMNAVVGQGLDIAVHSTYLPTKHKAIMKRSGPLYNAFFATDNPDGFAKLVERVLAIGANESFLTRVELAARVALIPNGGVSIEASFYYPQRLNDQEQELQNFVNGLLPSKPKHEHSGATESSADASPEQFVRDFRFTEDNRSNRVNIPGFKGEIYVPGDGRDYHEAVDQYAKSSYPNASWMQPWMVAYPKDTSDVIAAVSFALQNKKHVVARSGGHQYSGMSSGNDNTIVLSMDLLNRIEVSQDKTVVSVQAGAVLENIAAALCEKKVSLPHGECPFVGIGGHVQTGGYGHFTRSFGLALDRVESFVIVLADGTCKKIVRPPGEDLNNEIYWGVLGGGPGSFGVLTEIKFKLIPDGKHENSRSYQGGCWYDKKTFKNALLEAAKWTRGEWTAPDGNNNLPDDLEIMMTVASRENFPTARLISTFLLELVYTDVSSKFTKDPFTELVKNVKKDRWKIFDLTWLTVMKSSKTTPLSKIADSFVRRNLVDGREFRWPYKKRVNVTTVPLTDEFVEKFVDMCDEVVREGNLKLIFQMNVGGAKLNDPESAKLTAISRRDFLHQMVFDIFYRPGPEGERQALDFQERMGRLVNELYSPEKELRMIWGSFEAEKGMLDMKKKRVRELYYDDEIKYKRLQKLKKRLDPHNVFYTRFNVQHPEPSAML